MSYSNLMIYKAAFELMTHIERCVRRFERYYKYTTGSELRTMCSEILAKTAKLHGNFSDWRNGRLQYANYSTTLTPICELYGIYLQKSFLGMTDPNVAFWSSVEYQPASSVAILMSNGSRITYTKAGGNVKSRPIR